MGRLNFRPKGYKKVRKSRQRNLINNIKKAKI